jgi:myo-inositol-1(or 4)-monophosphatase
MTMDRLFFAELSRRARAAIDAELERGLGWDNKSAIGFDPVTDADRAAERALRAAIESRFPQHGIWGEEYGMVRPEARFRWSLDPVDGTRALICGLPSWAVLVGLLEDGHHIAGMIDLPAMDECLIAVDGKTRRNGNVVATSGCIQLSEARLSTTDPNLFVGNEHEAFERVRSACRLTRFGLDAMAYARVATGDIDLVIESGLKPHDYDALVAVVSGAGGHVGNWAGGNDLSAGSVVAAGSSQLYDQAVRLLSDHPAIG